MIKNSHDRFFFDNISTNKLVIIPIIIFIPLLGFGLSIASKTLNRKVKVSFITLAALPVFLGLFLQDISLIILSIIIQSLLGLILAIGSKTLNRKIKTIYISVAIVPIFLFFSGLLLANRYQISEFIYNLKADKIINELDDYIGIYEFDIASNNELLNNSILKINLENNNINIEMAEISDDKAYILTSINKELSHSLLKSDGFNIKTNDNEITISYTEEFGFNVLKRMTGGFYTSTLTTDEKGQIKTKTPYDFTIKYDIVLSKYSTSSINISYLDNNEKVILKKSERKFMPDYHFPIEQNVRLSLDIIEGSIGFTDSLYLVVKSFSQGSITGLELLDSKLNVIPLENVKVSQNRGILQIIGVKETIISDTFNMYVAPYGRKYIVLYAGQGKSAKLISREISQ